ncbi:MAG: cysteine desulfurase family protein [Chloroflexota bacterium]|nr:cysteine desulfurase family protein [Chloroflexota bacterium]
MTGMREVYLDYSASTPVDPRVLEAMMPYFSEVYGNSTSSHRQGRRSESAIEEARATVARILNCRPSEIVFTGCGSESDNLAIRGAAWLARRQGKAMRLITSPVEHAAVLNTVRQLADLMDIETVIAPVDGYGRVDPDRFADACREGAAVASIIYANNEVGTVNDMPSLASIARQHDVLFHSDAVQAGGQLTLDVGELGVDMLSLSAHKFYGPKGVGLLYVRDGIDLTSVSTGGGHEGGLRAGTHNTAFIMGLAKALELAYAEADARLSHFHELRERLIDGVLARIAGAKLSGHPAQRLPSHASFVLPGIDANALLMHLDMNGIAASSGSACKTGNPEPAAVLLALGFSPADATCGLRLSVGAHTTAADIDYALDVLTDAASKLRALKRALAT